MNEFDLIAKMRERLAPRGERVVVWSGDDAAAVRSGGAISVTSTDSFVEGVHFRLVTTSLRDLGHKCVAASLSDLAAMGASAGEAYIVLGLPHHLGEREVLELADGAEALAASCDVAICGGDVTRADELFVVVTVVGYVDAEEQLARRDSARPGDLVGVTGTLGGSGAGLLLLERKHHGGDLEAGQRLLERHLRPRPLLSTGRALVAAGVHAMIDVSDGVASDVVRICERSGVSAEVRLAGSADRGWCRRGGPGPRARSRRARCHRRGGLRAAVHGACRCARSHRCRGCRLAGELDRARPAR